MSTVSVKALRGVCAGVGRDLTQGEIADIDAFTAAELLGMGAVELVEPARDTQTVQAAVRRHASAMEAQAFRDARGV